MTAELQVVIFLACLISLDLYIITDKICNAWIKATRIDNGYDFMSREEANMWQLKRQQADEKYRK